MKILLTGDRLNSFEFTVLPKLQEVNTCGDKNQEIESTQALSGSNTDEKKHLEACYKKQQVNSRVKLLGIFLILASLAFYRSIFYKLDREITSSSKCPKEILAKLDKVDEVKTPVSPYEIVIKPWKGRHNVHGIFMLPVKDKSLKVLIVRIPGAGTFCGGAQHVGTSFEGVPAKPGYFFIQTNFRTRTSIWLIARGFANQLKDPRNWTLVNYYALAPAKIAHK